MEVTLYELCTLALPFKNRMASPEEIFRPIPTHYSQSLSNCISSCMSFNPSHRPPATDPFDMAQRTIREELKITDLKSANKAQLQVSQELPTNKLKVEGKSPQRASRAGLIRISAMEMDRALFTESPKSEDNLIAYACIPEGKYAATPD